MEMTKQMIVGTAAVALPGAVAGVFLAATPAALQGFSGCTLNGMTYSEGACIQDDCTMEVWQCFSGGWFMGCS